MRFGTGLVLTAALGWGGLVLVAAGQRPADRVPTATTPAPAQAAPVSGQGAGTARDSRDYLGSAACARCHEEEQRQWESSLHVQMTRPVDQALIVGDFSDGRRFSDHDRSYTFGRRDGRPTVTIAFGDRPAETFSVDYTLGAKRYQGYLSTLPDGRIYVLPIFWHVEHKRWMDWKELTPIPDGAHDLRQIWNSNCFNCHATNIVQGYDIGEKRYDSTWTEMGVGCEACHGPGREHVALMDQWEQFPATKPSYDTTPANRGLTDLLKTLSTRTADPRRTFDTCAYCHGNKTNVFVGFRAGDRYEDYALPFLLSEDIPANDLQGEYWPDGRPNRFNRPQALTLSGCFKAGAVTCTNCHVAHGSGNEHSLKVNIYEGRNGDVLCTQCHDRPKAPDLRPPTVDAARTGAALRQAQGDPERSRRVGDRDPRDDAGALTDEQLRRGVVARPAVAAAPSFAGDGLQAHTFHAPDSAGSRCINCHMSDVNWRLLIRRRDHTFWAPTPEVTARYGVPNACTTCHDDLTPEWAAAQMDAWWGDGERRRASLSIADVMYRAGSGDPAVVPDLVRIALDRSNGMLLRASAADYLARMLLGASAGDARPQSQTSLASSTSSSQPRAVLPPEAITPALVNALIGIAADPEPTVRAAAVSALGATGQLDKVAPALTARLVDPARIVRARAAEALLTMGVTTLPGAVGQALARAQEDYAQGLQEFPDVASNHASRGWLEAERGNEKAASDALDAAIQVEPNFARPYVLKGVLAARAERYDEAIDWWKKARSVDAAYPRLNELIAEAEKRKGR